MTLPPLSIINGRIVDPSQQMDRVANLRIHGGTIVEVGSSPGDTDDVFDAAGKIVLPGLIDMHVHLREPGYEENETIETGTKAAIH
jgi:dihydroorotase